MRYALHDTNIKVVEIIPPAVKTNLGGSHDFGKDLNECAQPTMDRFEAGETEIGYKFSDTARLADRSALDGMMNHLASTMQVEKF